MTTTAAPSREKLTINSRVTCARPMEWAEVPTEPAIELRRAPAAPKTIATLPPYYDRIKSLLDRWAEWQPTASTVTNGAPRRSAGAPDARIHSFEDMEIESDKLVCNAVDVAVWELPTIERTAVMLHYGIQKTSHWRADFDIVFDLAVASLYDRLKHRLSC